MENILGPQHIDGPNATALVSRERPGPLAQLRRVARLVGPWLVAGLLLYLVAGEIASQGGPRTGEMAPGLTVALDSGESFELASHRGDVVVLNFWATWCPACRTEAPQLARAGHNLEALGVRLVGLSVDRMPLSSVTRAARRLGIDFPIGMADQALARSFSVDVLPTTIVVGRDGRVAETFVGGIGSSQLERAVAEALDEQ